MPGPPCREYWRADAVFVGLVKAKEIKDEFTKSASGEMVRRLNADIRVTFSITEAFRGASGKEIDVFTTNGGGSCGYDFQRDRVYIVYAYEYPKGSGKLHASICSRTQMFSESSPDIAYARSLAKAQPGSVISGSVTLIREDAGNSSAPLSDARVIVTGEDKEVDVTTDNDGRFKTPTLPAGEYIVRLEPPEGMSAPEEKVTVADGGCAEVLFWPRWDGRLSGTVLNADGQPATGVRIHLVRVEKIGLLAWVNICHSGEDSRYELKGIQPGRYRVALQHIGLSNTPTKTIFYHPGVSDPGRAEIISFGEGQIISDFYLRLPPLPRQKTIEGMVMKEDGKPLAGVLVNYGAPNENMTSKVKTDEYGRFSLKVYEGVKYSARIIIDLGGPFAYFKWNDVPADSDKSPMKIVIDPNRPLGIL